MRDELLKFIARREQRVTLGDLVVVVREMESAADVAGLRGIDDTERQYRMLVRCAFAEDGTPAFTDADIPALMAGSKFKLMPLLAAVAEVNGYDTQANEKNSQAAPGSDSSST